MVTARKTPRAAKAAAPIYQLRIELVDVQPEVWRRVWVPGSITLTVLHVVILRSMGWGGGHMHEFSIAGQPYGTLEPDFGDDRDILDDKKATLMGTVGGLKSFHYLYDYGDNWEHTIKVEKLLPADPKLKLPLCLAGENACPPDDCGGPYGYADIIEILRDPEHEEHNETLKWIGGAFDPAAFDLAEVNERLAEFKL